MLCCEECGCVSDRARGWIGQVIEDVDDPGRGKEIAVYCPLCARREFEVVPPRGLPYT